MGLNKVRDSIPSESLINKFNDEHNCCLVFDIDDDMRILITYYDFGTGDMYEGVFTSRLISSTFPANIKADINQLFYKIYESEDDAESTDGAED